MFACEGVPLVIATLLLGAAEAVAQPSGRLDLLARESAQWMVGSVEASPTLATPTVVVITLVVALVAALLGAFLGMRRRAPARGAPVRARGFSSGAEVLDRLQHVLSDVERVAGEIRTPAPSVATSATQSDATAALATSRNAPAVVFARAREVERDARPVLAVTGARTIPAQPARGDRLEEARSLLHDGMDPAGVQARTGLRLAEIDLLRASPRVASGSYA
jgi:hypothetical protein